MPLHFRNASAASEYYIPTNRSLIGHYSWRGWHRRAWAYGKGKNRRAERNLPDFFGLCPRCQKKFPEKLSKIVVDGGGGAGRSDYEKFLLDSIFPTKLTEFPTKLTEFPTKLTEFPTKLTEFPTKLTEFVPFNLFL